MRLNAYLARAGVASRRGADELIKRGTVQLNGQIGKLNDTVRESDQVLVHGKPVKLQQNRYTLLYKPAGYVTTLKDEKGRRKVTDLIDIPERVVPVGRLDYDTTGLLVLTNDGGMVHRLTHPSYEIDKTYQAQVEGRIDGKILDLLSNSILLEDGPTTPAKARKLAGDKVELIVHEGRKHQVKRMLAAVGLPVKKLHRSGYGPLTLEGLKPGQWRDLTFEEVHALQDLT